MNNRDGISQTKGIRLTAVIAISLVGLTAILTVLDIDLTIQKQFYTTEKGWYLRDAPIWAFLYSYGTVPGIIFSLLSLFGVFFASIYPRLLPYRRKFLVVVLTAILGAGIIVNAVLKPYWGRPRPREVKAFNGLWEYRHPHQIGIPGQGKSFPCGHCTMGFLFVTMFFFADKSRRLAIAGGVFGILYGSLIGLCRMVQGAHFLTDAIWSLGAILLVSIPLYYLILPRLDAMKPVSQGLSLKRKVIYGVITLVVAVFITIAFLTRRPFFETDSHQFRLKPEIDTIQIVANADFVKSDIQYQPRDTGQVIIHTQGFGWTRASVDVVQNGRVEGNVYRLNCRMVATGYFAELEQHLQILLPVKYKQRLKISVEKGNE